MPKFRGGGGEIMLEAHLHSQLKPRNVMISYVNKNRYTVSELRCLFLCDINSVISARHTLDKPQLTRFNA